MEGGAGVSVSDMCYCKDCGASIVYVRTAAGKKMPCNSIRVDYVSDFEGGDRVMTDKGVFDDGFIVPDPGFDTDKGYIPHMWTCKKKKRIPESEVPDAVVSFEAESGDCVSVTFKGGQAVMTGAVTRRKPSAMSSRDDSFSSQRDGRRARMAERDLPVEFEQFSLFPPPVPEPVYAFDMGDF